MQLEYKEKMDPYFVGQAIMPFQPSIIDSGVCSEEIPFGYPLALAKATVSDPFGAEVVKKLTASDEFHGVAVLIDGVGQDAYAVVTPANPGPGQDVITEAVARYKEKAPCAIMKAGRVVVKLPESAAVLGEEVFPQADGTFSTTDTNTVLGSVKAIVHRPAPEDGGLGIVELFRK